MNVYGHRGAAAIAPENTIAAVRAAFEAGADGVECDVRLSADGRLVVIHDEDPARTTGRAGSVPAMTFAELRGLEAGAWFDPRFAGERVPSLEEVWEVSAGRLIVEIKARWGSRDGHEAAAALAAFLAGRDTTNAVVASFDLLALAAFRTLAPPVATAALATASVDAASLIGAAVDGGHPYCLMPAAVAGASALRAASSAGCGVIVWTVDDPTQLRELRDADAAGVICDDPGAALVALRR